MSICWFSQYLMAMTMYLYSYELKKQGQYTELVKNSSNKRLHLANVDFSLYKYED